MAKQELEIFVHGQGTKPLVLLAQAEDVLRNVLTRNQLLQEGQDDVLVFAGECEEALAEQDDVENGIDQHSPVDITLTLEVLRIGHHHHIHCHRCRHVAVAVNFGGRTKHRRFSPATTVGVVTQWARKKFQLDPAAAAEYVLQICGSTDQPRSDKHLGELVEAPQCSVCFDLVKEVTPQG